MVYALMCGTNQGDANEFEFLAGCNRFALDNPIPTVTRRIAFYGNNEDVVKLIDNLAVKINQNPIPYIGYGQYSKLSDVNNPPRPLMDATMASTGAHPAGLFKDL
jgi:hypothetical protein